jgi:hypothetical protein
VSRISRDYTIRSHTCAAEFGSMRSRRAACGGAHLHSAGSSSGRRSEPRHCARPFGPCSVAVGGRPTHARVRRRTLSSLARFLGGRVGRARIPVRWLAAADPFSQRPRDQYPVELFSAYCAVPSLSVPVRPQCTHRSVMDADDLAGEHGIEGAGELGVPIPDQNLNVATRGRRGSSPSCEPAGQPTLRPDWW